jgi:FAD/FMN-containing dehydrogenase
MSGYSGIVEFKDNRIRVKAGTRLAEICDYLNARDLQLATLPEFLGISAGACFFVDVHGSSSQYFSIYDLIEEIRYLDERGEEVVSARDEVLWTELRARHSRFILTEIAFRTEPASWLSNRCIPNDASWKSSTSSSSKRARSASRTAASRNSRLAPTSAPPASARLRASRRAR